MGNSLSPAEKRRSEIMYESGVLIPPSFGISAGGDSPPPSSILARTPSLVTILQQTSLSHQLLSYHTTPGVWLLAKTNEGGSILASTSVPTDRGYQEGLVTWRQNISDRNTVQLRAPTIGTSTFYGSVLLNSSLIASSQVDNDGHGWLALNVDASDLANRLLVRKSEYYRNDPCPDNITRSVQLGSWTNVQKYRTPISISGYAAYQAPGVTVSAEGTLPLGNLEPEFSYHLSCDLTDNGPPVIVNLSKSPKYSSLSFSQLVTFDRYHANPLDDRARRVRNTLGWTVEMRKDNDNQVAQLSAAVAWQVNRALALKVTHKGGNLGGVILFKRWRQPRVTLALLFGIPTGEEARRVSFCGFGIELETFAKQEDNDVYGLSENTKVLLTKDAPATKVMFPK